MTPICLSPRSWYEGMNIWVSEMKEPISPINFFYPVEGVTPVPAGGGPRPDGAGNPCPDSTEGVVNIHGANIVLMTFLVCLTNLS